MLYVYSIVQQGQRKKGIIIITLANIFSKRVSISVSVNDSGCNKSLMLSVLLIKE